MKILSYVKVLTDRRASEQEFPDYLQSLLAEYTKDSIRESLADYLNGGYEEDPEVEGQIKEYLSDQCYKIRVLTKVMKPGRKEWRERIYAPYYDYVGSNWSREAYEKAQAQRKVDEEAFEQGTYNFRPSAIRGKGIYRGLNEKFTFLLNTCSDEHRDQIQGLIWGKERLTISYLPSLDPNYKRPQQLLYLCSFEELLNSIYNSRKMIEVSW